MAKSVVKLNAKGKIVKSYAKWGIIADLVKYGIPVAYISTQFNIFTTNDARVQLGGGAILVGFVSWSFIRNKIKLAVEKYKKLADTKTNSTLFGVSMLSLAVILTGIYFIIWQTVYLLVVFGVTSLFGDLVFRSKYYAMKNIYDKALKLQQENDLQESITL